MITAKDSNQYAENYTKNMYESRWNKIKSGLTF